MNTRNIRPIPSGLILGLLLAAPLSSTVRAAVEINVETSTLGHAIFDPNRPSLPPVQPRSVLDFLIDQDQGSGGGGLLPNVSVNWDTNAQFSLTVSAPPGKKFEVRVPSGHAVGFGGNLWWESTRGGFSPYGSVTATFGGLEGTPPAFTSSDSALSDSHGFFGFVDLEGTRVTNSFAFTSLRLTATVTPQVTGNGTEDYVPHLESAMSLYYQTTETNDPGRFVFIVPANAPATNNVLPIVNWIQPTNGNFNAGVPISLRARATDSDGTILFVDFYANSLFLGRTAGPATNSNYNLTWTNPPAGSFQLRAEAVDNRAGRGVSASAFIVVNGTNAPATNNVLPIVTWIAPTNWNFVAGVGIPMRARATDVDGTIAFVEFYAGTLYLGRTMGPTSNSFYNLTWTNPPAGAHSLHAEAVDNSGGRGFSATVLANVGGGTNAPQTNNILPNVEWAQPANGAVFTAGNSILMSARATDWNGTVSFVEFYAGETYLGRGTKILTNALYLLTWTNPPVGTFQLHAEAVDNAGGRGLSASVQIIVAGGDAGFDLGVVEVPTIGHEIFSPFPEMPEGPNQNRTVVDYLIDQDQRSGGGAILSPVSINWDNHREFRLTVAAPPGMKFLVSVPPGRSVGFGGYLWWESTRGGFSPSGPVAATFGNLEGAAPDFSASDATLSDSHGYFGFVDVESTSVSNSFAFTSLTLTGTVTPQVTGNGAENYIPHLESALTLRYSTSETNDPGRFVSIVPLDLLPRIQVLEMSPDDGARLLIFGRAGRTHIVECSPDTVGWIPISTNVMPATICPVCPSVPVTDANGTSAGNRFYRVVELP